MMAYTYVYNEQDVIEESLAHMLDQGLSVYVLDNWSTDNTRQIVTEMTYRYPQRLYMERFPFDAAPRWFELRPILDRIQALHYQLDPGWGMVFGADELFEAPHGQSVAEFLEAVGQRGYTCVGSVQATFHPVDNAWAPGKSMKDHFKFWNHGQQQNNRAWKARSFSFAAGGHDVSFVGKSVYPDGALILRHYPFRNQAQAEHKTFIDRKPRYSPDEVRIGWHTHMDSVKPGYNFIKAPEGLHAYRDPKSFYEELRCPPKS